MSDTKAPAKPFVAQSVPGSLRAYFLPLAFLVLPAAGMYLLAGSVSTLQPVFNVMFLLAVAAAAWWGGIVPGFLAAVMAMLLFGAMATHARSVSPANFRLTGFFILVAIAALVSQVARARRKAEEALLASNLLLEKRVQERTEDLDRALRSLRQSNDELQHFADAVSHDLQEPLRGLTASTQLLQRRLPTELSGEAQELMGDVLLGASRLNQLVRDLMAYTRALGEAPDQTASADLSEAVKAVKFNLREQIQAANAEIDCTNPTYLPISDVLLQQLLQNLISNALKYRGPDQPVVKIECGKHGDLWRIRVSDNGLGIHPDHHERVFEPFSRVNMRPEAAGTGLGLALFRRIVERSGGSIWVESELGKGSSFYFTLPASNATERRRLTPSAFGD
ncbi:MAG: ATP-binding protein [Bryobacteraceae bacterium]